MALVAIYLNALATLGIVYDHELSSFQKISQLLFVWLVPIFGAAFILFLVYQHSPNGIPRSWIPWPISWLIFGKVPEPNKNREILGGDEYGSGHGISEYTEGGDGSGDGD